LARRLGAVMIGADHRWLRPRRVAAIRAAGFQLAAFTVNDPARARLLFEWGVTSVFSDAPDIIRPDVIQRVGAGHGPARIFTAARRGLALARQGANR
jgi:glycerophosphoryl diester phosphodiesterase